MDRDAFTFFTTGTHPHLAPRLKKEYSYTATPPLGLRGPLWDELYLYQVKASRY